MTDRHYPMVASLLAALVTLAGCGGSSNNPQAGRTASSAPTTSSSSPIPTASSPSLPPYVAATVVTADAPNDIASGFGSVWVVTHRGGVVERINPASNKIVAKINSAGSELISIAVGAKHVWYLNAADQQVEGIDPRTDKVTVKTPVGTDGGGVAATDAGAWFAGPNGKVVRIDPATGHVAATRRLAPDDSFLTPFAIGGKLWVTDADHSNLYSLDPTSLRVLAKSHMPGQLGVFGYGFGSLWVGGYEGPLYQLDANTGKQLRQIKIAGVASIATGPKLLWVRATDVELDGINPRTGKVVMRYKDLPSAEVPGGGIDWDHKALWVANWSDNVVWRIPASS